MTHNEPLVALNLAEATIAEAIFERLFPADDTPGAAEIGVVAYLDRALAGAYAHHVETYRLGLRALDQAARTRYHAPFVECGPEEQDALLAALERSAIDGMLVPSQGSFFALLRAHLQEGLFADPAYGGNRDKLGWKTLGHPGVYLENSAEENLTPEPVTKNGVILSLADLGFALEGRPAPSETINYDPQRGALPPDGPCDVVLVGLGGMGGLIAPLLCETGLQVVALEAGAYRTKHDFVPDELGAAYYCRANMGPKFGQEIPRWQRNENEPTQEATFSLGRMMNSVGGSVIHYGAWLRRFHPHHFRSLSRVRERWGEGVLPQGCTLADWPFSYDELEPYYAIVERIVGVAGAKQHPDVWRSTPYPQPPLRPFRLGERFKQVTHGMGLLPHMVAAGMNSVPYDGRPATSYTAWSNGFGSFSDDKWHPGLSSIPQALATGNLDLRTHCRVLRVLTDNNGYTAGVEYIDALGRQQTQAARTVILCAYTYENVRLLFLSGDAKHPNGLGNNQGQVGKYYMTKMFAHVDGFFPDTVFNRHTGPAAQGVVLDDYLADGFDSVQHGFVGGATLGAENQFLPIQISREALPPDVRPWGKPYKDHLRRWQNQGVVRIQPDTLSYTNNYLELDPYHRDKSGLGLPVLRATYDLRANEQRLANWMENKAEEILRAMGATKTWRGPSFTGIGSSHDFGGARAGHDPATSVVNGELRVHDTPGLYVFGGAAFPTCPGINPTLTLWAMCYRAAEQLIARLQRGEES